MFKKILKGIGFFLLFLVVAAVAAPFLLKGKIMAFAKEKINQSVNAKVDFDDVDISFFKHFPKVAVGLKGLKVVGIDEFALDTLFSVNNFDASVDIMSVIGGKNFTIYAIDLDNPRIHALITKSGNPNWAIAKPDSAKAANPNENKPFQLKLQHYAIHNGFISYQDKKGNQSLEITGLDHSGSGDFTSELFTLATKTSANEINFSFGGVPYLHKAVATIDADFQIDNKLAKYSFETDKVKLNELQVSSGGYVQMEKDSSIKMDIHFKSPSTDFRNILSFVPAIYKNNFSSIKTKGSATFNGELKGVYSKKTLPGFNVNIGVKDGFFHYPDLPTAVQNINANLKIANPNGIPDNTTVDLTGGHIEIGSNPFDFNFSVKTPISNMYVAATAKGKLDFSTVASFVKLPTGTQLTGLLDANMDLAGHIADAQKKQLDKFDAKGTLQLTNLFYASTDYPKGVSVKDLLMTFNPTNITLNKAEGKYLSTTFSANGALNNVLGFMFKQQPLDGSLTFNADDVNLNELMGVSTDTTNKNPATAAPFIVPANMALTLNSNIAKVEYAKLAMQNLKGSIVIADETVKMNNVSANALDGTIGISGYYSTKNDKKNPEVSFAYDVKSIDIQKTFNTFNVVEKLMPIGQYMSGKLTSQLSLKGKMGENMTPNLSSFNGLGNLMLINGALSKFQPVEKLASSLNVASLKNISTKDLKAYIELSNGNLLVKPFNVNVGGIAMEIGGLSGLDKTLDYTINMKLPRNLVGAQGNDLLNGAMSKLNATAGSNIKLSEILNVQAKIKGSFNNPQITTDLKQMASSLASDMKQQIATFVQNKVDSTKKVVTAAVKDTVASVKKELIATGQEAIKNQLFGKKDTSSPTVAPTQAVKDKVENAGKGLLKNLNPFKH